MNAFMYDNTVYISLFLAYCQLANVYMFCAFIICNFAVEWPGDAQQLYM